jgi:hypothetical protein
MSARRRRRGAALALSSGLWLLLAWAPPAAAEMIAYISRFAVVRDGKPYLDDTFAGEAASLAAPRMVGGEPTTYFVFGFVPDGSVTGGKLTLDVANGAPSSTADGKGRRQLGARLMTNGDPKNPGRGLKRGVSFSASGLFDLVIPRTPVSGYGIRFNDLFGEHKGVNLASLFVFRDGTNQIVIRFLHQDFAAGKQYVVDEPAIDPAAGDQILLTLSHANPASDDVTAQYQLLRKGAPVSALVALKGSAPVFGGEQSWTRAEFFAFEAASPAGR